MNVSILSNDELLNYLAEKIKQYSESQTIQEELIKAVTVLREEIDVVLKEVAKRNISISADKV